MSVWRSGSGRLGTNKCSTIEKREVVSTTFTDSTSSRLISLCLGQPVVSLIPIPRSLPYISGTIFPNSVFINFDSPTGLASTQKNYRTIMCSTLSLFGLVFV